MVQHTEAAVARHDRMMREEKEQADALASRAASSDFWQGQAGRFRPPAEGSDDGVIGALSALIEPGDRVIDVGAGGGRIAVPLAARCKELIAIEPSPAMCGVLQEEIVKHHAANLRLIAERWEDADALPAEVVFASNVTYSIAVIEPFLRKMDAVATRHAALIVMLNPPQSMFAPFWQAVHGVTRLRLPCRDELVAALEELGARPEVAALPPLPPQSLGKAEEALEELRRRLFVGPGTDADAKLTRAMGVLTEERDGVVWIRGAGPRERFVVRWQPRSFT